MTGEEFDYDGPSLYDSIETRSRAGEMLLVTFRLFGEGLEADVETKYSALKSPAAEDVRDLGLERFDRDLRRTVGLFVNLLNAAENIEVRPAYLYALALVDEDISIERMEALLEALDGWLFFDFEATGEVAPQHELWSFRYLAHAIESESGETQTSAVPSRRDDTDEDGPPGTVVEETEATTLHKQFRTCLDALFALLEGSDLSEWWELSERSEGDVLADIDTDPDEEAVRLVEGLFGVGEDYPVLAPLVRSREKAAFSLAAWETCPPRAVAAASIARGGMLETRGQLERASAAYERARESLDQSDDTREMRARALLGQGGVQLARGNLDEARKRYSEALALVVQGSGDNQTEIVADCLGNLGLVAWSRGNLDEAQQYHDQSLAIARELGDRQGEATSLGNLGGGAQSRGNLDEAQQYHDQSLAIQRDIGDRQGEATSLGNLGTVAQSRGNLDEAEQYHDQSLAIQRDIGVLDDAPTSLRNLVEVCGEDRRTEDAHAWVNAARGLWRESERVSIDDIRPVSIAFARIDARTPADRVSELYYAGLHAHRDGDSVTMARTHAEAWRLRGEITSDSDAYDAALAAGVGVLALDKLLARVDELSCVEDVLDDDSDAANAINPDDIREMLDAERDRLPLAPAAVFEHIADGETDTEPEQLLNLTRSLADGSPEPPLAALVNGEFGRLLGALQQAGADETDS